jgi:hypothetical protein
MKRVLPVILAVVGLIALPASAAEFNLQAWSTIPGGGAGSVILPSPGMPLPDQPGEPGQPAILVDPDLDTPTFVQIVLMVSTDKPGVGVSGIDMGLLGGGVPPNGTYSGDPGLPDPFVSISHSTFFGGSINEEIGGAGVGWSGSQPISGDANLDTYYAAPFTAQIGGYTDGDASGYAGGDVMYLGDVVAQPLGMEDPTVGAGGVFVPFMYLALHIDAAGMEPGDKTYITVNGLGGLTDGTRPATWDWLGNVITDPGPPNNISGRIWVHAIPEPASIALLAIAGVPAILRRRK